jgi:hypothetical protein
VTLRLSLTMEPQSFRASQKRSYEALVRNTSSSDRAGPTSPCTFSVVGMGAPTWCSNTKSVASAVHAKARYPMA